MHKEVATRVSESKCSSTSGTCKNLRVMGVGQNVKPVVGGCAQFTRMLQRNDDGMHINFDKCNECLTQEEAERVKRSGRFYRTHEESVMRQLGFEPTKGSGSGWLEKEDGQNEHLIAQLKTTDASQIAVREIDLDRLVQNATVTHKLPVFVIEFLETGNMWLLVRPHEMQDVSDALSGVMKHGIGDFAEQIKMTAERVSDSVRMSAKAEMGIVSSAEAREAFERERRSRYDKTKYIGGSNE